MSDQNNMNQIIEAVTKACSRVTEIQIQAALEGFKLQMQHNETREKAQSQAKDARVKALVESLPQLFSLVFSRLETIRADRKEQRLHEQKEWEHEEKLQAMKMETAKSASGYGKKVAPSAEDLTEKRMPNGRHNSESEMSKN